MIIPAGKHKHQVNQGGRKNETIMDSDIFSKLAAELGAVKDPIDKPEVSIENPQPERPDPSGSSDPSIQNAVEQGTLAQNAPPKPAESPKLDWKTVAAQVEDFVQKISNGTLEVKDQKRGPDGTWTITFGPIGVAR
jgi:hypothetical protein